MLLQRLTKLGLTQKSFSRRVIGTINIFLWCLYLFSDNISFSLCLYWPMLILHICMFSVVALWFCHVSIFTFSTSIMCIYIMTRIILFSVTSNATQPLFSLHLIIVHLNFKWLIDTLKSKQSPQCFFLFWPSKKYNIYIIIYCDLAPTHQYTVNCSSWSAISK